MPQNHRSWTSFNNHCFYSPCYSSSRPVCRASTLTPVLHPSPPRPPLLSGTTTRSPDIHFCHLFVCSGLSSAAASLSSSPLPPLLFCNSGLNAAFRRHYSWNNFSFTSSLSFFLYLFDIRYWNFANANSLFGTIPQSIIHDLYPLLPLSNPIPCGKWNGDGVALNSPDYLASFRYGIITHERRHEFNWKGRVEMAENEVRGYHKAIVEEDGNNLD